MNLRFAAARAPAVSLAEAAMLPALPRTVPGMPQNLRVPRDASAFRPMPGVQNGGGAADHAPRRRGSMAGRAILKMVQPK